MTPSIPHNPDAQPYWDAARDQRLILRKCTACGRLHFPPRQICPTCWSEALSWIDATGTGRVYSYTIVHRAPDPTFAAKVPYALAMIALEEGPRIVANIDYDKSRPLAIGDRVRVYFEAGPDQITRPQFRRIEGTAAENS